MGQLGDTDCSKGIVVGRLRRSRNNKKMTFGDSKACQQCILSMGFYGIRRVCYSSKSLDHDLGDFVRCDLEGLCNTYRTASTVIVKF